MAKINGRTIAVRGLKRKEIRGLEKYGFTYLGCIPKYENAIEAQEAAFELVLDPKDIEFLDDQNNTAALDVWKEILAETYGSRDEEKN